MYCKYLNAFAGDFKCNVMSKKNVQTRKDVEKILEIREKKHKFTPRHTFKGPPYQLPTGQDVIERCISSKNWKDAKNCRMVAIEIHDIWIWCNIYPVSKQTISSKVQLLVTKFDK